LINQKEEALSGHEWLGGMLKRVYTEPDKRNGEAVGYYADGSLRFQYPILNDKFHGTGRTWYEGGAVQSEEQHHNGYLHGVSRKYYPDGKIASEIYYSMGVCHGAKKRWYKNGKLKIVLPYIHGRLHGTRIEWYESGVMKMRMAYFDDFRHGYQYIWDPNGVLESKTMYVRNARVSAHINHLIQSKTLTAQDILKISNSTVRRICLEELGYGVFLSQVEHEILDKDGEYELVRVNWHKREEPIVLVKVKCPTTGAFYTLRVPPRMRKVKQAVAWTFHMKKDDYNPLKEA